MEPKKTYMPRIVSVHDAEPFDLAEFVDRQVINTMPGTVGYEGEPGISDFEKSYHELKGEIPQLRQGMRLSESEKTKIKDAIRFVFESDPIPVNQIKKLQKQYYDIGNWSKRKRKKFPSNLAWDYAEKWIERLSPTPFMMREMHGVLLPDPALKDIIRTAIMLEMPMTNIMLTSALCVVPGRVDRDFLNTVREAGVFKDLYYPFNYVVVCGIVNLDEIYSDNVIRKQLRSFRKIR